MHAHYPWFTFGMKPDDLVTPTSPSPSTANTHPQVVSSAVGAPVTDRANSAQSDQRRQFTQQLSVEFANNCLSLMSCRFNIGTYGCCFSKRRLTFAKVLA